MDGFTVGLDLGRVGTWLRLALGVALPIYLIGGDIPGDVDGPRDVLAILAAFVGLTVVYTLGFVAYGRLRRPAPWPATVAFYGPILTMVYVDVPTTFGIGLGLYIAVSTLVAVTMRYGGCEVIGIPTLLLRRRYVVYCPWNLHADLADRLLSTARPSLPAVFVVALGVAAVSLGFTDLGPLPDIRWEARLLAASATGVFLAGAWRSVTRRRDALTIT